MRLYTSSKRRDAFAPHSTNFAVFLKTIRNIDGCIYMNYALIDLQREEKLLQRILIDPALTEKEHNIVRQIIDCIRMQIEDIILILA